jgi:hypothetical protein
LTFEGIIRWSHDGGPTWTNDIVLTSTGWVQRVRFASRKDALIMDLVDGSTNSAQYTTDGGGTAADWTNLVPNPHGGWFGLEFSRLPNLAEVRFHRKSRAGCIAPPTVGKLGAAVLWMILGRSVRFVSLRRISAGPQAGISIPKLVACTSAAMAVRPDSLDANTGAEMEASDSKPVGTKFQVWCAGYNSSLSGVVYTLKGIGAEEFVALNRSFDSIGWEA